MDHFLATAQHNAVHLLEMVQDVMFKLLQRQQNAQLIVIRRPAETGETADQILTRCREVLKG